MNIPFFHSQPSTTITLRLNGEDHVIEVRAHETIAQAAERKGFLVFGGCRGQGICGGCRRKVHDDLELLFDQKKQKVHASSEREPYVLTCKTTVMASGAIIDADKEQWSF